MSGEKGRKPGPRKPSSPARPAAPPSAAGAPPKRKPAGPKRPSRKGGSKGWRRLAKDVAIWLAWRAGALGLGVLAAVALIVGVLYRQALLDVDGLLQAPLVTNSGRVLSGPVEYWPGLVATVDEVAEDLQRAGYARVSAIDGPGDFTVSESGIRLRLPAAEGPGWRTKAEEVELTFADGRIALAGGRTRLRLAPAELAGVRGPENEARRTVPLDAIPTHLVEAVLAMEDSRFRDHEGLDPLGIARALLINAWAGSTRQGGSTLTQQLVKNLFLSRERTYERKAREALLAVAVEQRLSKDSILELYLNEIYLGQASGASICGVDQAARAFFGKPVQRLDLAESATIAGIISAPNRWSPLRYPEEALQRRDIALARMAEVGAVSEAEAAAASALPLQVHALSTGRLAPWAVDAALMKAEEQLEAGAVAAQGLTVHTSIQPALQRIAERAVADSIVELERDHPSAKGVEMSLVAVRVSDGAIVAMVGGRDYAESQFDRVFANRRQVGSTVKPLTWLYAFDADASLSPATIIQDVPIERTIDGKVWTPRNYDGAFVETISLRDALVASRNIPAILLAERVGMRTLAARWKGAGLTEATDWPSAALGSFEASSIELAQAYSAFPRGGTTIAPELLRAIAGPDGELLFEAEEAAVRRVADAPSAFFVTDTLREVLIRGTGRKASSYGVTGAVGAKTGTTDDGRDAWMAGFTPDLVVIVWVGFDRGRSHGLSGGQAALPAWSRFVVGSGTMGGRIAAPKEIQQVTVCRSTGRPPCEDCEASVEDWFRHNQAPAADCAPARGNLVQQLRETLGGKDKPAAEGEGEAEGGRGWFRRRTDR